MANEKDKASQSTIKMEKGYYTEMAKLAAKSGIPVAIHNKNGKGLLLLSQGFLNISRREGRNPQ